MLDKLVILKERFLSLQEQLSDPEVSGDMKRFTKLNKEYRKLEPLALAHDKYKDLLDSIKECKEILSDSSSDDDFRAMAKEEYEEKQEELEPLEAYIKDLLIPKDPEDEKDIMLEIRSGTGGDEAAIFAGDLLRMYERYIDKHGWKREYVATNESEAGGYSKVVLQVFGDDVYGMLKYESGTHRVQRIPKTETQGRVHTSAATVAILPIFEMEDVAINPADLKWDTYRASGAGGQHVNKTESAVRVTHLLTGIVAESQESRSQHKNREIVLQKLYAAMYEAQKQKHESSISDMRRSLVVSGDRSAKIRTYNYPQNRVTDHRINFTKHNLGEIMEGALDEIIEALRVANNAEKMKQGALDELG